MESRYDLPVLENADPELRIQIQALLDTRPIASEGVNLWLFTALKIRRLRLEPQTIEELLEDATADYDRNTKGDEIVEIGYRS